MLGVLMDQAKVLRPWKTVVVAGFGADRVRSFVGKAARVVELPAKPDDMLLRYGATAETFRRACRYAQPAH